MKNIHTFKLLMVMMVMWNEVTKQDFCSLSYMEALVGLYDYKQTRDMF